MNGFRYEAPIHTLKTHPGPFQAVWEGRKTHEWRRDDRDFQVGHRLVLCEYDPADGSYSGRKVEAIITYISRGPEFGIPHGFAVLSINARWRGDDRAMVAL